MAFPDSSSVLDKFQSAINAPFLNELFTSGFSRGKTYRRGIGVRGKGVTGRDATVHKRRRNSSQKATQ